MPKLLLWALIACVLTFPGLAPKLRAASGSTDMVTLAGQTLPRTNLYQLSFTAKARTTYPIGVSVDLVNWSLLTNLTGTGARLTFTDLQSAQYQRRYYHVGVPISPTNMVFIRPGTFTMGSPDTEDGHDTKEGPLTVVTLTQGFWIGKYEVSQAEFTNVMGTNIAWFKSDQRLPAESVSWLLATNYCYRLTEKERAAGRLPAGYAYRLPTEAEWEYACRAGSTTPFGIGNGTDLGSAQANFDGNFPYGGASPGPYLNKTTLPGHYVPNAWGLFDMHGNVWEWCQDWYGPYPGGMVTDPKGPATGSEHVLRGGGYPSVGKGCRSAERDSRRPSYASIFYGFRVVLAPGSR